MVVDLARKSKACRPPRSRAGYASLVIGFVLGFLLAQRGYIEFMRYSLTIPTTALTLSSGSKHSGLLELLQKIAPTKEVLVTVSDIRMMQGDKMLETWLQCVQRTKTTNYVVVALDKELKQALDEKNTPVFLHEFDVTSSIQANTGDNHAISAQKYGIVSGFLRLGWSVLLCDTDVVILKNPFLYLYRDHDLEAMSDGFDQGTAYGAIYSHDDPSMGWAHYAQGIHHYNLNSGLFWIASNKLTLNLMSRLSTRLANDKYWDQTAFNEEIFFLSHGSYQSSRVSVRVMDISLFMNSKYLFKIARLLPIADQPDPVLVHMNYHPDKHKRMVAVVRRYVGEDLYALDSLPGGSEPGS